MGKKLISITPGEKYLSVTWQVNNWCNFKCSYCNPGNWSGTDKNNGNLGQYLYNLDAIIKLYKAQGYKQFKFFFSGGEPTMWKNLIPICEWLRHELPECSIAVNTNLSRPLSWWKKHYHLFDDVVASFHIEHADKNSYEKNTLFLCDKLNYLSSKMLMHDDRFWEVVEYGEHLKKVLPNYHIEWTPLFDEMSIHAKPWEYKDPEKVKFLENHTVDHAETIFKPHKESRTISYANYSDGTTVHVDSNELIINRENFFKGWNCDVGDCIFINPVGNVSLSSCGEGGQVGNILDDISGIGPNSVICGKEHCHCGTDILIPKAAMEKKIKIVKKNA
jgi:organic radical activating enzyme